MATASWSRCEGTLRVLCSYCWSSRSIPWVRSRVNWVEKGEKNNKYFLNLEKANKNKSTIRSIVHQNSEVVKDQKTISNEIKEFYEFLYTNKDVNLSSDDAMTFLDDDAVPKLSYDQ